LRAAGAQPVDQLPKLVHALGPPALEPWDLATPVLDPRASVAELVSARLLGSAARLVDHHAILVLEGRVTELRRGARRLRSDLQNFAPLLDGEAVRPIARDLRWLTAELRPARDLDMLIARLRADAESAPEAFTDAPVERLLRRFAQERERQAEHAARIVRRARYSDLLERLAALAAEPPLPRDVAKSPASDVLLPLVRRRVKRLRREARALDDPGWHGEVRRARFAIEAVVPLVGSPARRSARELAALQYLLAERRRAELALARLRELADSKERWTGGVLSGIELARAAAAREQVPSAWERTARRFSWLD
jgi:CHAD domain-containing protein